jgi:hypothetical protein
MLFFIGALLPVFRVVSSTYNAKGVPRPETSIRGLVEKATATFDADNCCNICADLHHLLRYISYIQKLIIQTFLVAMSLDIFDGDVVAF